MALLNNKQRHELDKKALHAEAQQKLLDLIIYKDLKAIQSRL